MTDLIERMGINLKVMRENKKKIIWKGNFWLIAAKGSLKGISVDILMPQIQFPGPRMESGPASMSRNFFSGR